MTLGFFSKKSIHNVVKNNPVNDKFILKIITFATSK